MYSRDDLLFAEQQPDLSDFLTAHGKAAGARFAQSLSSSDFETKSDDDLAREFRGHEILPITLDLQNVKSRIDDATAEVRDFGNRYAKVPGFKASRIIPFTGDPRLWKLRTSTFDFSPPSGVVRANEKSKFRASWRRIGSMMRLGCWKRC